MYEDVPPLKVWAFTAVAALGLLFLFLGYCYNGYYSPYSKELKKGKVSLPAALIENNMKDTSSVSVVVVGSSLLERALVDPEEVEKAIFSQTHKPTNVLRVSIYYMSMDIAERLDFFENVVKYPPDYLFIENIGINLDDPFGEFLPTPIDAALLHLRNQFREKSGLPMHENYYNRWYTFDIKPSSTNAFYTFEFDSATYKFLETKKMILRKVEDNTRANKAYEALRGKTKIFFLGMPQASKLEPNFLDKAGNEEFNKVMASYKKLYDIDYWQYPEIMPDSCFTDGFHLNRIGAAKYQDWFVTKLASIK